MNKSKNIVLKCDCGKTVSKENFEFWGECIKCRKVLPIQTKQTRDGKNSASNHDRIYHGGMGYRSEW
jgi:hypothetical protein